MKEDVVKKAMKAVADSLINNQSALQDLDPLMVKASAPVNGVITEPFSTTAAKNTPITQADWEAGLGTQLPKSQLNWLFNEITTGVMDLQAAGVLPYNDIITYIIGSWVSVVTKTASTGTPVIPAGTPLLYYAIKANAPGASVMAPPTDGSTGNSAWKLYSGSGSSSTGVSKLNGLDGSVGITATATEIITVGKSNQDITLATNTGPLNTFITNNTTVAKNVIDISGNTSDISTNTKSISALDQSAVLTDYATAVTAGNIPKWIAGGVNTQKKLNGPGYGVTVTGGTAASKAKLVQLGDTGKFSATVLPSVAMNSSQYFDETATPVATVEVAFTTAVAKWVMPLAIGDMLVLEWASTATGNPIETDIFVCTAVNSPSVFADWVEYKMDVGVMSWNKATGVITNTEIGAAIATTTEWKDQAAIISAFDSSLKSDITPIVKDNTAARWTAKYIFAADTSVPITPAATATLRKNSVFYSVDGSSYDSTAAFLITLG